MRDKSYLRSVSFKDINPGRLILEILLIVSLIFNVILKSDNDYMELKFKYMKHQFIEEVVGYNYCDKD